MSTFKQACFVALALGVCGLPELAMAQELGEGLTLVADTVTGTLANAPEDDVATSVRLIVLLTTLSFVPAMLMVMTPFTRFIIVFALMRQAIGLQQSPPNQVLVGLAFMLSMVVMQPNLDRVNEEGLQPYLNGELTTMEAYEKGIAPMREFMLNNMKREDMATSLRLARLKSPKTLDEIPTSVVVTGFMLSELRSAFVIGVKVYLPFLVIDIIIASVLLGMGMMMIPPVVISLPFKLIVFVLMDGFSLLVTGMVTGFS
jgi:flagellar biosynthetic protein FliP